MLKTLLNLPKSTSEYIAKTWKELRAMEWIPIGKALKLTLAVVLFTIVLTAFIYGVDAVLVAARNYLFNI